MGEQEKELEQITCWAGMSQILAAGISKNAAFDFYIPQWEFYDKETYPETICRETICW